MNTKKTLVLTLGTIVLLAFALVSRMLAIDDIFYSLNFLSPPAQVSDSVVIVGIDAKSVERVEGWPWPRTTLARLFELVDSGSPKALALDFLFPPRSDQAANDSLAAVFSRIDNLVLPFRVAEFSRNEDNHAVAVPAEVLKHRFVMITNSENLANTSFYQASEITLPDTVFSRYAKRGGYLNVSTTKASQKMREIIHVIQVGSEYFPSFGLSAVATYLDLRPDEFVLDGKPEVRLGSITLPLTPYAASVFVNFRGRGGTITTLSAADVLDGTVSPSVFRNKLVLAGITEPGIVADFLITPVGSSFPGVEVWATAAMDILNGTWVRYGGGMPSVLNWILALLIFPGLAILLPNRKKVIAMVGGIGVVCVSVGMSVVLFRTSYYFWNPVNHVAAWALSIVWLALQKADPTLIETGSLDFDPRDTDDKATLAPPSDSDFPSELPDMDSAKHVGDKAASSEEQLALAGGKVVRSLGSGGMADVYQIWNARMDVYRAVKVLKPDQPERFLKRFETEIRILSNLNHPNIVQCYSVGDWYGLPYLEMEYIHGVQLEDMLSKRGILPPEEAAAVGILVCRALHYAHKQVVSIYGKTYRGVIHRDLKPSNVMLSRSGHIKLTDFGIARPTEVSLHTGDTGVIIGTLPYLAPEQAEGKELTPRADMYALGVTLYELLTGQRAFPQREVTALLSAKATGQITALSPALGIPEPLVKIVNKAMETDPQKRYESALAMEKDLESAFRILTKAQGVEVVKQMVDRYWT